MNLKARAQQLKTDIPAIFLCLRSPQTPLLAKILAAVTVCYALSPIDLVPDFIPILGYSDDLILLPLLVSLTIKALPSDLFNQYRQEAAGLWQVGKPQKWYYALPILIFWLIIIYWIGKSLIKF